MNRYQRQEAAYEGPHAQCDKHSADPDGSTQKPADAGNSDFDAGAHKGDGQVGEPNESGHDAVAWSRPKLRAEVERVKECQSDKAEGEISDLGEWPLWVGEHSRGGICGEADDRDVEERAKPGQFSQGDPCNKHKQRDQVCRPTERDIEGFGGAFCEHVPAGCAKPGLDEQHDGGPVSHQAEQELGDPTCLSGRPDLGECVHVR
ncbi:hypothetical protein SAV14893_000340 [Streptomyces avermitilis]|uniref:Uncharacterized protein n=1 Tax=Streptomyces avermitilis TaxID=33903 RepID=A0A4D4N5K6_STRAX|nr:hypothetical protein SAVMC3_12280 [Streptomyces avermitilis]GDY60641.1 hypothetical protein SAV14893_000340 [Streptomyces avermitilis]GDY79284.1 hypothetical protein SAV31267_087690 [Streptomyces avermitilis]GDY87886.1 hypothetical protein SAVCW2_70850 [Streptomyces avermitilis]